MARRRKRIALIALPAAVLLLLPLAGHDYVRSAAFVALAADLPGLPSTLAGLAADEVLETDAGIPWRGGTLRARLFRPSHGLVSLNHIDAAPPTLLLPGVHAAGIDEPRLVEFARDLAATGRTVVAAELPTLKAYRITEATTDMIEDAAAWLAGPAGLTQDGRVGLVGISFAGGLAIVAASRPSVAPRVAFVLSFGGHGDLPRTLRYLSTGRLPDGTTRPPHDYGVAIILLGVADRVVPADQAEPLRDAILAFLHASHVDMWDKTKAQEEFARARRMAEALPEPARMLMGHVNDREVDALGPLLLPHVEALGGSPALSPSSADPAFPVYLLHGTDDNVIPAHESVLLAGTLRERGARVRQLATPLVTHAEVDRSAAARAFWELVRFWADVLDAE